MASASASYFKAIVAVAATLWLMIQARSVLAPVLISVLVWFLLNALARLYTRITYGAETAAKGAGAWAKGLSAVSFLALIAGLSVMTSKSVAGFRENLPTYQENLKAMFGKLGALVGMEGPLKFQTLMDQVDFGNLALGLAGTALGFLTSLIVVLVYVAFIFAEEGAYEAKLAALAPDREHRAGLAETVSAIVREIETYLGVKCVVGAAQAIPTFVVLYALDVDGAAFWAVLIFVFSFVPTIGSLIGIVFPSVVALAQFPSPTPFFITVAYRDPALGLELAGAEADGAIPQPQRPGDPVRDLRRRRGLGHHRRAHCRALALGRRDRVFTHRDDAPRSSDPLERWKDLIPKSPSRVLLPRYPVFLPTDVRFRARRGQSGSATIYGEGRGRPWVGASGR